MVHRFSTHAPGVPPSHWGTPDGFITGSSYINVGIAKNNKTPFFDGLYTAHLLGGWFIIAIPTLPWMISGDPYFRKPPNRLQTWKKKWRSRVIVF